MTADLRGGGSPVRRNWGGNSCRVQVACVGHFLGYFRSKQDSGRGATHLSHTHTHIHSHIDTLQLIGGLDTAEGVHAGQDFTCWQREETFSLYLLIIVLWVSYLLWSWCSPSSSSRLAPPPVLTWLTLSSVFHLAQQVAVSPPPGQNTHEYLQQKL